MQKIATRIFIGSSLVFGIIGIILVFSSPEGGDNAEPNATLIKLLLATACIILSSFAVSIATKYLSK